ncbi:MAG TPA: 30S ribosomal protein S20 [Alphaproteobacteria bacterium]|nr:30S ribosomal protein S20 [Rhodospirillaceae bacterium]HRJ11887.1 30S ribosomal protein S20 [Alphaproteobacteria bacterium]
MPQHKSAKTRVRRNARREDINTARKSRIRSAVRAMTEATAAGDAKAAEAQLRKTTAEVQRGVSKGVLQKNTAARTVSRLTKAMKKLSA